MVYVYALISDIDGRIYVGMTEDVLLRLQQHNYGMSKSTRPYRPWKVLYQEECADRTAARKRELQLKSGYGKEFLVTVVVQRLPADSAGLPADSSGLPAGRQG